MSYPKISFAEGTTHGVPDDSLQSPDKNKKSDKIYDIIWSDMKGSGCDFVYTGKELINPDWVDILYFTGIAGLTTSSMAFDESLDKIWREQSNKSIDDLLDITNNFGDGLYGILFSGGLYTGALLTGSDNLRITARLMFESLALAGLTTTLFKISFGRARPYMNTGNMDFQWFEFSNNYNSFPSGHTTAAFALASVAAGRIDSWWSYPLFFTGAALTGAARINKGQHWLSDVILGAVIGTASGFFVVDAENQCNDKVGDNISQKFFIYPDLYGIGFGWKF